MQQIPGFAAMDVDGQVRVCDHGVCVGGVEAPRSDAGRWADGDVADQTGVFFGEGDEDGDVAGPKGEGRGAVVEVCEAFARGVANAELDGWFVVSVDGDGRAVRCEEKVVDWS